VLFVGDTNTALANLLADNVHFATDASIRFEQALTLQREWGPRRAGTVVVRPESFRGAGMQLRPQFTSPAALLDVRVRRALAHTVDRSALNDGLFEGQGIMTEAPFITPTMSYFPEIDRAITKYSYDPRAADQLMTGAGYRRGGDGGWSGASEGRLHLEIKTLAATEREKEMAILADGWRQTGFDVSETVLPASQAADNQSRATFSSIFTYSTSEGDYALAAINSAAIGTAENRWIGTNRAGWVNPEFDRLSAAFKAAVAQEERVRHVASMAKLFTEDLPAIPLLFDQRVYAHTAALTGPRQVAQEALIAWDVHRWELK
jgi:peptide/nickel transport system substrate-binding protein